MTVSLYFGLFPLFKNRKTISSRAPRKINFSLAAAFLCAFSMCAYSVPGYADNAPTNRSAEAMVLHSALGPIQDLHNDLHGEIEAFQKAIELFCAEKNEAQFGGLRMAWLSAMQSWSRLAPINFGPIDEMNIVWRFQFWPDPINLVHRKFKSRVRGKNNKIDAPSLAKSSVAIQGLSALEYLLFDPDNISLAAFQSQEHMCSLLVNTTHNLISQSEKLSKAWRESYPPRWLIDNEHTQRLLEKYYSGVVMALGAIKRDKLAKPLGLLVESLDSQKGLSKGASTKPSESFPNPWQLESWRSQSSLVQIENVMRQSEALYSMEFGLDWYLRHQNSENQALSRAIKEAFAEAIAAVSAIEQSAFVAISNGDVDELMRLFSSVDKLHQMLKVDYARAANIQFRFNAHDGD